MLCIPIVLTRNNMRFNVGYSNSANETISVGELLLHISDGTCDQMMSGMEYCTHEICKSSCIARSSRY